MTAVWTDTVWVVTRTTYYDEDEFVSAHASEEGALKQCGALNEQILRLDQVVRRAYNDYPGKYQWKEVEVQK